MNGEQVNEATPAASIKLHDMECAYDNRHGSKCTCATTPTVEAGVQAETPVNVWERYERLWSECHAFSATYCGLTPEFRVVQVSWAMGTWSFNKEKATRPAYKRFPQYPLTQFIGGKGFGKTSAQHVTGAMSYNPQDKGLETPAVLFSAMNAGCTLLLDEVDKAPSADVRKVLRLCWDKGKKISRLRPNADGQMTMVDYDVYNPVCLAGVSALDDDALQSRILTENMTKVGRRESGNWKPPELCEKFKPEADRLRAMLGKVAPMAIGLVNPYKVWEAMEADEELPPMDSRSMQALLPIYALTPTAYMEAFYAFAKRHLGYVTRMSSDSPEVTVFLALVDMGMPRTFLCKDVATSINTTLGIAERTPDAWTYKSVSARLKNLGLEPDPTTQHMRLGNPYACSPTEYGELAASLGVLLPKTTGKPS